MKNKDVKYFRIYKSYGVKGSYRSAYIEVTNGKVTAASPALAFMISWKLDKVFIQVEKYLFKITHYVNGSRNTAYVTERPTKEEREDARLNK